MKQDIVNMKQRFKLMLGDNMESLKKLPDNSIDSVVVDPPYGLGKERDMNIILKDWIEKGYSEIDGKGFMGKEWDAYVPQPIFWKEIFRVLKPGGHILAFFGTRTYDIGTMAIRLAGFEIRDQIMWLYGSGFPKSHNISKKIEQEIDNLIYNDIWKNKLDNVKIVEPTLRKSQIEVGSNMEKQNSAQENVAVINKEKPNYQNVIVVENNSTEAHHILKDNPIVQENVGQFTIQQQDLVKCVEQLNEDQIVKLLNIFIVEESVKDMLKESSMNKIKVEEVQKTLNGNEKFFVSEIIPVLCAVLPKILKHIILNQSRTFQNLDTKSQMDYVYATNVIITKSIMEHLIGNTVNILKRRIEFTIDTGHTSLKPANEPICLARKPLSEKSVAENVLKWKTGGINVDGCRVGSDIRNNGSTLRNIKGNGYDAQISSQRQRIEREDSIVEGRFPANIILECICDEVIKGEKGEVIKTNRIRKMEAGGGLEINKDKNVEGIDNYNDKGDIHTDPNCPCRLLDEQSGIKASRFFYQSKVSKAERNMGLDGIILQLSNFCVSIDYNNKEIKLWESTDQKARHQEVMELLAQKDIDELQLKKVMENTICEWNTGSYGNNTMDLYQMVATFTTLMVTNLITELKILNVLIEQNTNENISECILKTEFGGNIVANVMSGNPKNIIIEQKKDGCQDNVDLVELKQQLKINVKENKNIHATVKPVNLMAYLCRLITPEGGIVLDPFMGSGSTGIAAQLEGFRFVGMEMDNDYFKIAEARIDNYEKYKKFLK